VDAYRDQPFSRTRGSCSRITLIQFLRLTLAAQHGMRFGARGDARTRAEQRFASRFT
jgi:hypothetical protein